MSTTDQDGADKLSKKRPELIKGGSRFVREKLHGKRLVIPSFITVIGLFCGFLAIIRAVKGDYEYATKCIALAIILDGLDGRVARRLNATSPFGRELDSLSDLIAFGVAPAVLTYSWAFAHTADEFGFLVAFIFVVCGATRLARFNIEATGEVKKRSQSFTGLPIPGAAAAIAAIIYCFPERVESDYAVVFMLVYMTLVAGFMVSTVPFPSIKHVKLTQGNPRLNFVILAALVALTWKYNRIVILLGSTLYAWSGPLGGLWARFFPKSFEERKEFIGLSS